MKHNILIILSLVLLNANFTYCQEAEEENSVFEIKSDFMSRYIWRGSNLGGESPSIQPTLSINFSDSTHAVSIGTWAAYNYNTTSQEVDLFLSYTFKDAIFLCFYDYYFPGNSFYTPAHHKYFNYDSETTGHVFEGTVCFLGTEKIPFSLLFAMNLYGYDSRKINEDGSSGDIFMSKYLELGYNKTFKNIDFSAFVGAALDDPDEDKGETGYYYNEKIGVINIGVKASKSVKITDKFELPIQTSLIANPQTESIFVVFGFSL
ncbi:MAG: hypothetical protein A2046_00945 [Bacteroidetes bacterium GWA2_30_7]|nr:MAG: hypothetical protein A2046_00945 [Bacteroidetes bacterium GWA2_30_7]